jgi:outer membrane immunogenic protein
MNIKELVMRKVLLPLLASLAIASPALANEARVEARGGVIWNDGDSEAIAGVAAGYDFDLGGSTFAGVEASADKILESNTRLAFGFSGRAGVKLSEAGKLYGIGGYTTKACRFCDDSLHLGAGYQHNFGQSLYGKVEYRHYFFDNGVSDPDAVVAGVGMRF